MAAQLPDSARRLPKKSPNQALFLEMPLGNAPHRPYGRSLSICCADDLMEFLACIKTPVGFELLGCILRWFTRPQARRHCNSIMQGAPSGAGSTSFRKRFMHLLGTACHPLNFNLPAHFIDLLPLDSAYASLAGLQSHSSAASLQPAEPSAKQSVPLKQHVVYVSEM